MKILRNLILQEIDRIAELFKDEQFYYFVSVIGNSDLHFEIRVRNHEIFEVLYRDEKQGIILDKLKNIKNIDDFMEVADECGVGDIEI